MLAEDLAILYERIVNITTREVRGHEALVRGSWKSERHAPNRLFQLVEETGLVFEICERGAIGGEGRESNPPGTRRRAPHSI